MWDYDKLFADNNIIGIGTSESEATNLVVGLENIEKLIANFKNEQLANNLFEIKYVLRLDGHGNVIEKLFDRERDMESKPEPMPELKTGMFVRVYDKSEDKTILAFVYKEEKRVIYQDGDFDDIADVIKGDYTKIVEVYPASVPSFNCCYRGAEIWRSPESN